MRTVLLLCCPFLRFAQEHSVPIGSDGNQVVLTIENASNSLIRDVQVNVRSAPAWVAFKTTSVVIDSIPSKAWRDAAFEFRVPEEKADQTAAIVLTIADARGYLLGKRVIKLRTALLPRETKLHHPYPNPANPSTTIQYTLHTLGTIILPLLLSAEEITAMDFPLNRNCQFTKLWSYRHATNPFPGIAGFPVLAAGARAQRSRWHRGQSARVGG
jgi:hypothetical protein